MVMYSSASSVIFFFLIFFFTIFANTIHWFTNWLCAINTLKWHWHYLRFCFPKMFNGFISSDFLYHASISFISASCIDLRSITLWLMSRIDSSTSRNLCSYLKMMPPKHIHATTIFLIQARLIEIIALSDTVLMFAERYVFSSLLISPIQQLTNHPHSYILK